MERKLCRIAALLIALLIALTALLGREHSINKNHQERIDLLVDSGLSDSKDAFLSYLKEAKSEDFLFGVSSFGLVKNLYPETTYHDDKYSAVISNAYAKLLFSNDLNSHELYVLVDALSALERNPLDVTGYTGLQLFVDYSDYS